MGRARATAAAIRNGAKRARFLAWAAHLELELRRRGGRLLLDAPHGAELDAAPHLKVVMKGKGDGTLALRVGRNVSIGRNVLLEAYAPGTNVLDLGDDSYILDGVRVMLRSGRIVIGPRSNLRDYVQVKSEGDLILGTGEAPGARCEEVSAGHRSVIRCTERIELLELVGTGERVTMIDSQKRHDG